MNAKTNPLSSIVRLNELKAAIESFDSNPKALIDIYLYFEQHEMCAAILALTYLLKLSDTEKNKALALSPLYQPLKQKGIESHHSLHAKLYSAIQPLEYERRDHHLRALLGDFSDQELTELLECDDYDGPKSDNTSRSGISCAQYIAWFYPERIQNIKIPNTKGTCSKIIRSRDEPSGINTLCKFGKLSFPLLISHTEGHFIMLPSAEKIISHHPTQYKNTMYNREALASFLSNYTNPHHLCARSCTPKNLEILRSYYSQICADSKQDQLLLKNEINKIQSVIKYCKTHDIQSHLLGQLFLVWLYPNFHGFHLEQEVSKELTPLIQEIMPYYIETTINMLNTINPNSLESRYFLDELFTSHDAWTCQKDETMLYESHLDLFITLSPRFIQSPKTFVLRENAVSQDRLRKILERPALPITEGFINAQEISSLLKFRLYAKLYLQEVDLSCHWSLKILKILKAYLKSCYRTITLWYFGTADCRKLHSSNTKDGSYCSAKLKCPQESQPKPLRDAAVAKSECIDDLPVCDVVLNKN